MSAVFCFKQFSVIQDNASMKVGTDGVLLGAWCDVANKHRVLDIGTGTGLISLMIAQRNPESKIQSIELDEAAFEDAGRNFINSKWSDRLKLICGNVNEYIPPHKFDLIVSNPPFFTKSLTSSNKQQNLARHDHQLSPQQIFSFSSTYLDDKGKLCLIYPSGRYAELITSAQSNGMHLSSCLYLKPTPAKVPHRILMEFVKTKPQTIQEDELIIEQNGRHQYSEAYKSLTKAFYPAF